MKMHIKHTLIHTYRIFANIAIGAITMKAWKLLHYIAEIMQIEGMGCIDIDILTKLNQININKHNPCMYK